MKPAVTLWSPALVCIDGGAEAAMMLGGPRWREGGRGLEETAAVGSDWGRFALQQILLDVVCVALQPGSI